MQSGHSRIIVVSNRLPLNIVERGKELVADRSIGGLATALSSVFARHNPLWVGWTGLQRELTDSELAGVDLPDMVVPVQAPEEVTRRYYIHISNRVLWPTLHELEVTFEPSEADWNAYQDMTMRFARAVQRVAKPTDRIWIHDMHLMLLPGVLRSLGIANKIGFFLHSPFPRAAHFSRIGKARELLESLCAADLVGLQTNRDVEAFWETLKELRLLDQPGLVRSFPIGVDFQLYRSALQRESAQTIYRRLRNRAKGKEVIMSLSRLDYTKGIVTQLRAVEQFFKQQKHPQDYTYVLIVAPSREAVPEYQVLKQQIDAEVLRINKQMGRIGWKPVEYIYRNIDIDEVAAYYQLARVLLLTPHMDGMNLIAKEYIAGRQDDEGMLVLSTATGAAFQLTDAVLVDASDVADIAKGLARACSMTSSERHKRWLRLRATVRDQDVFWWASQFMHALVARPDDTQV